MIDHRGITTHSKDPNGPTFCFPIAPDVDCKWDAGFLDPTYKRLQGSEHSGIDINLKAMLELRSQDPERDYGYPVRNVVPGYVTFSGRMYLPNGKKSSYGRVVQVKVEPWYHLYIEAKLGRRFETLLFNYCHLSQEACTVGDYLNSGDVVGGMGGSGKEEYSYPSHLHFSIQIVDSHDGRPVIAQAGKTAQQILREFLNPAEIIGARSGKFNISDVPNAVSQGRIVYKP